ncbi:MAG: gamma-glutamyltransferase [Bacteroidetes bacterium]|nr:gamma-glutamyltransferase [Bacteroidota bacterium]
MKTKILVLFLNLALTYPSFSQSYFPKESKKGMVVSTNDIATKVGLSVLQNGGNAIDAAVATAFAMAVTYPSCGNIGGDGFMLIHKSDGTVTSIDFRVKAPANSQMDMFIDLKSRKMRSSGMENLDILDSPKSIGIPGTVAGLELAHKKYGKISWKELLQPAIDLAENGFPVGIALHKEMEECKKYFEMFPSSKAFFLKKDGSIYEVGEIWKQPDMAKTLKEIQKKGKDGFYNSSITKLIVKGIQEYGGVVTEKDFNNYQAIEREPVKGTYRGFDFYGMSLPCSGGITELETLNILENFNLKDYAHNSAKHIHILAEAFKQAFRDRSLYLGDPDFNTNIPINELTSKEYAQEIASRIDTLRASTSDTLELWKANESLETTHFSVADAEGNGVSVTYSLGGDFGSYFVPEGTGVVFNNNMGDFNYAPNLKLRTANIGTKPNWIEPGKRPLSSMTPTILAKNGKLIAVLGSPGGPTIITTNVQVISNLIDFQMNIAEAIAAPRIFHGWIPNQIIMQWFTTSSDSQELLKKMGHIVLPYKDLRFGPAMGIWIDQELKIIYGACDPRSLDGSALGF